MTKFRVMARELLLVVSVVMLVVVPVALTGCDDGAMGVGDPAAGAMGVSASPMQLVEPTPAQAQVPGLTGGGASLADIAERSVPGVVNIFTSRVVSAREQMGPLFGNPFFEHFLGQRPEGQKLPERREQSLGSGVIVRADGIVLTNNHVVERATDIRVGFSDGRQIEATIVGTDPASDLAVLRLKEVPQGLKPLALGDSSKMRLGEVVLAIGNPFGLGHTVTMGIVSATGRANIGITDYEDFIQTDAAINPGNSGGALINMRGELVGVNTAIASRSGGYQGIGFAIPANMAEGIMQSLLKDGRVVRGWLGIMIQDVTGDLAKTLELPVEKGVLVSDVVAEGPAAKAGIERGDVIVAIDGKAVEEPSQLRNTVAMKGAAKSVTVSLYRGKSRRDVQVMLGELPAELTRAGQNGPGAKDEAAPAGLSLSELTPQLRNELKVPKSVKGGVVVMNVEAGSKAAGAGLSRGDVVVEVNRASVKSVGEFKAAYEKSAERVLLLVLREERTRFVVLPK